MSIEFEVADRIATITINRPEALNSMTASMYTQLSESWIEVRDNPDIWVAVVTGAPQPNRSPDRQVFFCRRRSQGAISSHECEPRTRSV